MKIMKVLGVVVGIHVFALILIFANPGCSSTTKPSPAPVDTVASNQPAPSVTATGVAPSVSVPLSSSPISAAPINFNPDAPALAAGGGIRFSPTRPNTSAAATLVAEPVADVTPASTYGVKSGDSLWTIAKRNNLTVPELAAANNLKTNASLHEGQKLLIPAKKSAATMTSVATPSATAATAKPSDAAAAAAKNGSAEQVKYTVKTGESLSAIAKTFGVKQGDIAVANNITDPQKIRAGMVLVIPGGGWQTPGKSGAGKQTATKSGASATTKAAVPEIKPVFSAPVISPGAGNDAKPATSGDVPVIKVDEMPAAEAKPKT